MVLAIVGAGHLKGLGNYLSEGISDPDAELARLSSQIADLDGAAGHLFAVGVETFGREGEAGGCRH